MRAFGRPGGGRKVTVTMEIRAEVKVLAL